MYWMTSAPTAEGHYTRIVAVWKANAGMPLCAPIFPLLCSNGISPEMCQGLMAREQVVDAGLVVPKQ